MLDLTRVFSSSASDGVFVSNSDFKLKYIGDQVFNGNYDIILTGVPSDTILNPSQRNYIEGVAFDFLEQHVDGVYALEVLGQVIETSGQRLRGLQESGTAQVGATVYGIGENPEAFFENVDDAFSKYQSQFLKEISLSQYRPGEINDNENYGKLFGDLFSVTVLRSQTNVTNTNNVSGDGETGFTSEMQIIMWSVILALSVLFLIYKCATDFFCVGAGNRIKKQTLSNKMKRDKKDQALLDNLGKKTPQQRPNSFSNSEKAKEDDSRTVERPGRAEPSKRGIGKSNTFNGPEGFFGSKPKPDDNKSGGRREPSRRGVGRSSTFSGVEGFFGSNRNAPESERPARREPTRGVGKSNTFSGVDGFFGSSRPESSGRREPSKRGVQRSNTSEGAFLRESPATSASGGREAPASRGVGNSNSFGGFFGDRPPRRPKKNKEEKKKKKKKKSSSSEKKSKKSPRKKTAPRKQRSDAPPPRAPTTDRSPAMPPRSRRVDMVGQRRPSL